MVWHYTNGAALNNIIVNNELWASNTAFMNDAGERRLADAYLLEARKRSAKDQSLDNCIRDFGDWQDRLRFMSPTWATDGTRYLLSASNSGDSLTMWRGYARTDEVSYAIGIDPTVPLSILSPRPAPSRFREPIIRDWFNIDYDPTSATSKAAAAVRKIEKVWTAKSHPQDQGATITVIDEVTEKLRDELKHEGFKHEEESRVVANVEDWLLWYRPGRLGTIPYVKLTGAGRSSSESRIAHQPGKLPIREIRLSPGADRFYPLATLKSFLTANGYGPNISPNNPHDPLEIRVSSSQIPFR